jgi:hypothetical protein
MFNTRLKDFYDLWAIAGAFDFEGVTLARAIASPIVTIQTVSAKLAVSFPTASTALANLVKLGVVHETTGRQRGRIYAYSDYLALLDRGTDPLPT